MGETRTEKIEQKDNVTANQIVTFLRQFDSLLSVADVAEVDEADSAPIPDSPEQAKKRANFADALKVAMLAAGCDAAKVDMLVVKRQITGARQRITPVWATVCSPLAIAFWADRTDDRIAQDLPKLLRRDGGEIGPEALYEQMIVGASTPADAAKKINAHVGQRIGSARTYVVMGLNELRRRGEERAGRDHKAAKYLKVTLVGVTVPIIDVLGQPVLNGTDAVNVAGDIERPMEVGAEFDDVEVLPADSAGVGDESEVGEVMVVVTDAGTGAAKLSDVDETGGVNEVESAIPDATVNGVVLVGATVNVEERTEFDEAAAVDAVETIAADAAVSAEVK